MPGIRIVIVLLTVALLAGCAQEIVLDKEDMLAAAGFRSKLATTPEQIASLQALPPHKFVRQVRNGQQVWLYADPTVCRCVYAGNQRAWQTFAVSAARPYPTADGRSVPILRIART